MSFADLERGEGQGPLGARGAGAHELSGGEIDAAFTSLKDALSIQIFKIQSNVQGIQRLVDKLGTPQDGQSLRTSLTNLTDATRDMVKRSTEDVKKLANWPGSGTAASSRKPIQNKISKDFTAALTAFQRVQKISAEKQRHFVEDQKRQVDEAYHDEEDGELASGEGGHLLQSQQQQLQQQAPQIAPQELAFQESMIAERESEIREIESGIHELNEIFRDLGTIVVEQGGMLDNIESNVTSVAQNTRSAAEELTTAHEYQRKAGRRMLCLALILIVVVTIVLLAILS